MGKVLETRPIREDEYATVLELIRATFGEESTEEDARASAAAFPFDRSLAVYERGRMVATSAVYSMELTVPGAQSLPMGGVTWISTLPTHRRRGFLRQLLAAHSADMLERGESVSGLGASEGTIYGRFGYGPSTSTLSFSVERAHSAFRTDWSGSSGGSLTFLSAQEAASELPGIYESLRLRVPGTVSRPSGLWEAYFADPPSERDGATRAMYVLHLNGAGAPDGYASYRVKLNLSGSTSSNEVRVIEVVAPDPDCYASLWRYLLDTDLAETVTCERGRVGEPLRWLLADPRRFTVSALSDFLWLRLLDVPRALSARRYASSGPLVLEVTDTFPDSRTTRYVLDTEEVTTLTAAGSGTGAGLSPDNAFTHAATCATTTAPADLALDAGALACVYLGGTSLATLAAAGRARELKPGALTRADAMFLSGSAPFCATEF